MYASRLYLSFIFTCSVGVVVTLQPGLHTNQIMLIHKKDDVLGPVNLIYKTEFLESRNTTATSSQWCLIVLETATYVKLTSKVMCQAKQQSNSLIVVITWTAGSSEHQGLSPGSSRGPKDPIDICAFHNLVRNSTKKHSF